MEDTMKRKDIYLTQQQIKALARLSKKNGLSVSEIIRRAIDEYLEKHIGKYTK